MTTDNQPNDGDKKPEWVRVNPSMVNINNPMSPENSDTPLYYIQIGRMVHIRVGKTDYILDVKSEDL